MLADGLGVDTPVRTEIEDVETAGVGAKEECLGRKNAQNCWVFGCGGGAIPGREANLGNDLPCLWREVLDDGVSAGGIEGWM